MRCTKNAKLGTFLDVSSFETPFSYCGRMSDAKVSTYSGFTSGYLSYKWLVTAPNLKNWVEKMVSIYSNVLKTRKL